MNVAVVRREIARALQSFGCLIVVPLSQREEAPVGPTRRFTRSELRKLRELRFSLHVVTDLKSSEADVEVRTSSLYCGDDLVGRSLARLQALSAHRAASRMVIAIFFIVI